ncbi:uncharacterized protein [Drosophila tropicalis]|uniref:uncharacterized protein n=1 Tax=Drosophila tropicalis TaxID=46794 RepID=UPI0035ABB5AD
MRQSSGFHNSNNNNNRFNGGTSGILTAQHNQRQQHNNEQLQLQLNAAWQPLTHHNNWLILQATAASSVQRQTIEEQKEQEQKLELGNHVEQRGEQGGLPGNYYAYNHRYQNQNASQVSPPSPIVHDGGNYKQVRRATLSDPPTGSYVLAISQSMRRGQLRRQLPMATPLLQPTQSVAKDVEAYAARGKPEVRDRALTLTNAAFSHDDDAYAAVAVDTDDVDGDGDGPDISDKSSDLDIDAYLGPFERALVKVSNFCDTVRALISDEDERRPSKLDATAAVAATSKEVQGRYIRLASQEEDDDEEEGRKLKKLKKKIQKLLLPLLIAYKLKFLTLIPVLIGGLTLLVGTTGLAGFFFALFTAVMSLKTATGGGHGSKALLLKKI